MTLAAIGVPITAQQGNIWSCRVRTEWFFQQEYMKVSSLLSLRYEDDDNQFPLTLKTKKKAALGSGIDCNKGVYLLLAAQRILCNTLLDSCQAGFVSINSYRETNGHFTTVQTVGWICAQLSFNNRITLLLRRALLMITTAPDFDTICLVVNAQQLPRAIICNNFDLLRRTEGWTEKKRRMVRLAEILLKIFVAN